MNIIANIENNTVNQYYLTIKDQEILTQEDEVALFTKYQKNNDLDAAKKIVISHLRFVVHVAKSFSGYKFSQSDIIQEGNIGLMKAVKGFKLSEGVRFSTYAVQWIKASILEYVLKNFKMIKVTTTKEHKKLFFRLSKMKNDISTKWLSNDDAKNIAKKLNVSVDNVKIMEERMSSTFTSTDINSHDDDYYFTSELPDTNQEEIETLLIRKQEQENKKLLFNNALNSLNERDRDIIKHRFLSENKIKLKDLGNKHNISIERVRQLEKNAICKMTNFVSS